MQDSQQTGADPTRPLEAVCMVCDGIYAVPTVVADSRREAAERLVRVMRFPMCRDCAMAWDMKRCPDGEEHDWSFKGHGTLGDDGPPLKVGECRRCGAAYLNEA
jgi:hypothetical protein